MLYNVINYLTVKINQKIWKGTSVLLLVAIFLFSGIQFANLGVNTSASGITHQISPTIEKQVKSISGAGSVKSTGLVNPMTPSVKGYYGLNFNQTTLNPGLSRGVYILHNSLNASNPEYSVQFYENGLKNGTTWEVELDGTSLASTTNSIQFHEPNGSYAFNVVPVSGYGNTPPNGNVFVSGHNVTMNITFFPISTTTPPVWALVGASAVYNVTTINNNVSEIFNLTFTVSSVYNHNDTAQITMTSTNPQFHHIVMYQNWTQLGLWLGKGLISELNNASTNGFKNVTTNVKVTTPAGTFLTDQFNISSSNTTGNIYFDMYSGIFVKETFTNSTGKASIFLLHTNIPEGSSVVSNYSVTFTESTLPSGTTWYVYLTNSFKSGAITGTSHSFNLTNGSYSYNIATTNKTYHANAGSITVNGKNTQQSINFTKFTYTVTFTESGLSNGTHWSMTFNGTTSSSNGTTIKFSMSNGTYSYTVSNVLGYSSTNGSGSITVNGANAGKTIKFTSSSSGLSQTELYEISGAAVAVIAALGVIMFLRRK